MLLAALALCLVVGLGPAIGRTGRPPTADDPAFVQGQPVGPHRHRRPAAWRRRRPARASRSRSSTRRRPRTTTTSPARSTPRPTASAPPATPRRATASATTTTATAPTSPASRAAATDNGRGIAGVAPDATDPGRAGAGRPLRAEADCAAAGATADVVAGHPLGHRPRRRRDQPVARHRRRRPLRGPALGATPSTTPGPRA